MIHRILVLALMLVWCTGCGRPEVQTYRVPKTKPMGPAPAAPAAAAHAGHAHDASGPGFSVDLPDGWTEEAGSGMRLRSYRIADTSIDFYLIALSTGDLADNVNRWRRQVELPPLDADAIAAEVLALDVGGHEGQHIEIYNSELGKGIIATIIKRGTGYMFFTAKGSEDELRAQASAIRGFIESITF